MNCPYCGSKLNESHCKRCGFNFKQDEMIILWKSRNSYSSSISEITGSEKSEKHVDLLADASELSRYTRGTDQPTLKE